MRDGTDIIKVLKGNDESTAEAKFMNDFKFTNYAKLIMACNKIPITPDRTIAFGKRMIIINFSKIFYGNEDNVDLIDKLKTKEELSGLLNECLRRLPNVLQNGIRKLTKKVEKQTWDTYDASINPVEYFVREALEKTDNDEDNITI
jgi:putative DNA primase/helicase